MKGILTLIEIILWWIVAALFMVMLFFFGFVLYYQFQLNKIRDITKEINICSATYYEIIEALDKIKKTVDLWNK
jgi:sensor domain CHASE-containing protein